MVRLATIYWTIGLAAVLPFQLPAMADDGRVEKVETAPQPLEPKTVRVILLPPANDALFGMRPPASAKTAPATSGLPADDAPVVLLPTEPAKIVEDAAPVEAPKVAKRPPEIASQPPVSTAAPAKPLPEAAAVKPRPEPAKINKDAALVKIPSLPERPPFRPVLYKLEPGEYEQNTAATAREQPREPASFMGKVKRSFQPLTNLWPGNRSASQTASPAAEGNSRALAGPANDNPPEKSSFLKTLRFWER